MMGPRAALPMLLAAWASCRFPDLPLIETDASIDGLDDAAADGPGVPNVVITSGPAQTSTTGPRVTFEFTVRDGTAYCRFDSAQLTPCSSPVVANLSAGSHSFHVQAQNSSGGIDSDSRLWNVECLPRQSTEATFGLFRMDEGSGTTVANEHPQIQEPPPPNSQIRFGDPPHDPAWTTTGRYGSALRFSANAANETDRIYSSILTPDVSMFLGAHSIEMWVNPMPTYPHDLMLFYTTGGTQVGRMDYALKFVRSGGEGSFHLSVRSGAYGETLMSPLVPLGSYHHVAFSYNPGSAPLLFVDGNILRTTQNVTGTVANFTFDALTNFEGDVDELHLTFHPYDEVELLENWCPPR